MAYKPLNIYYLALDRERSISPFSKHFFPTPYPLVEFHVLASGWQSYFLDLKPCQRVPNFVWDADKA